MTACFCDRWSFRITYSSLASVCGRVHEWQLASSLLQQQLFDTSLSCCNPGRDVIRCQLSQEFSMTRVLNAATPSAKFDKIYKSAALLQTCTSSRLFVHSDGAASSCALVGCCDSTSPVEEVYDMVPSFWETLSCIAVLPGSSSVASCYCRDCYDYYVSLRKGHFSL